MIHNCKKHGLTEHRTRPDNKYLRCKKCVVEAVTKRRRKLKILAVEFKGGKCERCGYSKCVEALDFHHIDESKKTFGISQTGTTKSWERLKVELEKCIILCANCHREEHAKSTDG